MPEIDIYICESKFGGAIDRGPRTTTHDTRPRTHGRSRSRSRSPFCSLDFRDAGDGPQREVCPHLQRVAGGGERRSREYTYIYIYIHMYRERDIDICIDVYMYIYIYVFMSYLHI